MSLQNTEIKTYAYNVLLEDIYRGINSLASENVKNNTIPYVKDNPLPQDMNIVNGHHLADINKVQLELKAAKIGAKSLKWIYGADAALLGLELKSKENSPAEFQKAKENSKGYDSDPIIVLANVKRDLTEVGNRAANVADIAREGIKTNAQTAYLLDQFTEKSISRALKMNHIEESIGVLGNEAARKQKSILAKNMLKNISEYDSGIKESDLREEKRKNIARNCKSEKILGEVKNTFMKATGKYDNSQKAIFSILNNYYVKQETGLQMGKPLSPENKELFIKMFNECSKTDSPRLAQVLSESFFYSERLTHYDFSYDRIYRESELKSKLRISAPNAAKFEKDFGGINSLADEKVAKKLRERDREMQINRSPRLRGM